MTQRPQRSLAVLGVALLTLAALVGALFLALQERSVPARPPETGPRSTAPPHRRAAFPPHEASTSSAQSDATVAPAKALPPAPVPSTLTGQATPSTRRRPDAQRQEATLRVRLAFLQKRLDLARHELALAQREGATASKRAALGLQLDQIQSAVRKVEARLRLGRRTVPTDPAKPPHHQAPRLIPTP